MWPIILVFSILILGAIILSLTTFGRQILRELLGAKPNEESEESEIYPYYKVELLTPAEKLFYQTLTKAVDGKYLIFPKVRLGDIVNVEKGVDDWFSHWGKIKSRHVDFLICDKEQRFRCVIELDDCSHNTPKQKKNDKFLNEVLAVSDIRLIRQKAAIGYESLSLNKILDV